MMQRKENVGKRNLKFKKKTKKKIVGIFQGKLHSYAQVIKELD